MNSSTHACSLLRHHIPSRVYLCKGISSILTPTKRAYSGYSALSPAAGKGHAQAYASNSNTSRSGSNSNSSGSSSRMHSSSKHGGAAADDTSRVIKAAAERFRMQDTIQIMSRCSREFAWAAWDDGRRLWLLRNPDGLPSATLTLPPLLPNPSPGSSMTSYMQQLEAAAAADDPAVTAEEVGAAKGAAASAAVAAAAAATDGGDASGAGPTSSYLGWCLMVLLSADSAAMGLWHHGTLVRHKVCTGYTIRHSQGKSQATYERHGGGHKSAGSAIRQKETRRLWQEAASVLADWGPDIARCHKLFCSGDVRVWNLLYEARHPPPPVDRRDPRWQRVGIAVPRPRFKDLAAIHKALSFGELRQLTGEQ